MLFKPSKRYDKARAEVEAHLDHQVQKYASQGHVDWILWSYLRHRPYTPGVEMVTEFSSAVWQAVSSGTVSREAMLDYLGLDDGKSSD